MSGRPFIDSNVALYARDLGDPKQKIAVDLLADGVMFSVQLLNEVVNVCRRKLELDWSEVEELLADLHEACSSPMALDEHIHARAVRLARDHHIPIYDANVIAAALASGCAELLSEDMQDGQVFDDRLTVRNPFRHL